MQNGRGGNGSPRFGLLPVERAVTNMPTASCRVGDFEPNLGRVIVGSRTGRMLPIRPFKTCGISGQVNIRILARMYGVEIVFVNVADDPHIRKVGDGEGIGAPKPCTPDALVTCWSVITPEIGAKMSTTPRDDLCRCREAEVVRLLHRDRPWRPALCPPLFEALLAMAPLS